MNCSPGLIEALLDQELDAAQQAAVEQHLSTCAECSGVYARLRQQKAGIKAVSPYYSAPAELHQSIRRSLRRVEAEETAPATAGLPWRWLAVAASFLLFLSVSWNLVQSRRRVVEADLAGNVLTAHIRSLIGTHLVDVPSSDQHTVKPWFAGKLDFSPDVKDLEAQGFPLVGGRIEYLEGRRVAALIYRRRQHLINLLIWPDRSAPSDPAAVTRDGYNLLHWSNGTMTYWAVSDVSAPELRNLQALLR